MTSSDTPPRAIMSYTRVDDQYNSGYLTMFCEQLSKQVHLHTGAPFPIFQDIKDIQWGEDFAARIETALNTVQFFIPILTPSFFRSQYCRQELQQFLQRAAALGRNDLILPVYYIRCPQLEQPTRYAADPLVQALVQHQYVDWRDLRHDSFEQPQVKRMLSRMAEQICDAIERMEEEQRRREQEEEQRRREQEEELNRLRTIAFNPAHEPDPKKRNAAAEELDRRNADLRPALDLEHPAYWAQPIAPGPFLMGDDNGEYDDEKPAFVYPIRQPYALARFPVTNRQYQQFLADLQRQGRSQEAAQHRPKHGWNEAGYPAGRGNHPVVNVSWEDACAFAEWVNQLLHNKGSLSADEIVRLPTEPEWERAATYPVTLPPGPPGTGKRTYPWGNQWHSTLTSPGNPGTIAPANAERVIGGPSVVGIFPNGAADCVAEELAGNVWEWCGSVAQAYPLPEDIEVCTIYKTKEYHKNSYSLRGGSWGFDASLARGAYRLVVPPDDFNDPFGLRLARCSVL